jgi:hypothetical protein
MSKVLIMESKADQSWSAQILFISERFGVSEKPLGCKNEAHNNMNAFWEAQNQRVKNKNHELK